MILPTEFTSLPAVAAVPLALFPIRVRARQAALMLSMDWEELKALPFARLPYTRKKRVRYYYIGSLIEFAAAEDAAARQQGDDPRQFRITRGAGGTHAD
jgi:hypothetical protein